MVALIEKILQREEVVLCCIVVLYEQLSMVNTIHIQMRVTNFGTETSARASASPGLPCCLHGAGKKGKKKKKENALRLLLT